MAQHAGQQCGAGDIPFLFKRLLRKTAKGIPARLIVVGRLGQPHQLQQPLHRRLLIQRPGQQQIANAPRGRILCAHVTNHAVHRQLPSLIQRLVTGVRRVVAFDQSLVIISKLAPGIAEVPPILTGKGALCRGLLNVPHHLRKCRQIPLQPQGIRRPLGRHAMLQARPTKFCLLTPWTGRIAAIGEKTFRTIAFLRTTLRGHLGNPPPPIQCLAFLIQLEKNVANVIAVGRTHRHLDGPLINLRGQRPVLVQLSHPHQVAYPCVAHALRR